MFDKLISWMSPTWHMKRELHRTETAIQLEQSRVHLNQLQSHKTKPDWWESSRERRLYLKERELMQRSFYDAASPRPGSFQQGFLEAAGDVPNFENIELRAKARAILKNSTVAKGLLDNLVNSMAPIDLFPDPTAILDDGSPDTEFNNRMRDLFWEWGENPLVIGGMTVNQVFQQCAREIITTGEVLNFHHLWTMSERDELDLPVGYQLRIIESEQLDNLKNTFGDMGEEDNRIFQGIQCDPLGRRTFYWLRRGNPFHWLTLGDWQSLPYDAKDFTHGYIATAPSQYRGISWFAQSMDFLNQIGDMCWNELTASTQAATQTLVIKTLPITNFQEPPKRNGESEEPYEQEYRKVRQVPGMWPILRPNESVEGVKHNHPQTGTDQFTEFLIRLIAVGYPVKPSAIHGNFAGSSYSSEASCAIETLPRQKAINDFFVTHVAQPIYARLVKQALIENRFPGYSLNDIKKYRLTSAEWPQSQIKSINPQNDVQASLQKAIAGFSSFRKEARTWGADIVANLRDNAELLKIAEDMGIPKENVLKMFEIATAPIIVDSSQTPEK